MSRECRDPIKNKVVKGSRIIMWDSKSYKSDSSTPYDSILFPATVVCRYGYRSANFGIYPDVVDVEFDHRKGVSKAHFLDKIHSVISL